MNIKQFAFANLSGIKEVIPRKGNDFMKKQKSSPQVRLDLSTTGGTFLDNRKNEPYRRSDVAMLGIACDLTASYNKGTWYGPQAIIDASYQVEYEVPGFHIPLTDRVKINNQGIIECPKSVDDKGNVIKYSPKEIERLMNEMVNLAQGRAADIIKDEKLLMLFGGEHSVPNGVWNAMGKRYGPNVTVLQFDAHLDLRDTLDNLKYSHACIMRRARDKGFRVIQVGPRDHISGEEAEFIRKEGLKEDIYFCATQPDEFYEEFKGRISKEGVVHAPNIIRNGSLTELQRANLESKIGEAQQLWISIDVDGLDASNIPGTGTPLPMGLSREGLRRMIYRALKVVKEKHVHLVGFDINEVSPQLKREGKYHAVNTVSTMNEMDAALLAYNMLFWRYQERFSK